MPFFYDPIAFMPAAVRREKVCGGTLELRVARFIGRIETELIQCQKNASTSVTLNIGAHNLDILDTVVAQCRYAGYVTTPINRVGPTPNYRSDDVPTELHVSFDINAEEYKYVKHRVVEQHTVCLNNNINNNTEQPNEYKKPDGKPPTDDGVATLKSQRHDCDFCHCV